MNERYLLNQLVFVDKSASDHCIHRHYGHSLCSERAHKKSIFICGKRYIWWFRPTVCHSEFIYRFSVLPALSLDGILAMKIVEGFFTTELLKDFIDGLLDHMNPFPGPNLVVVMDNCWIHHAQAIRDMIKEWFVDLWHPLTFVLLTKFPAEWCVNFCPAILLTSTQLSLHSPNSKLTSDEGNILLFQ